MSNNDQLSQTNKLPKSRSKLAKVLLISGGILFLIFVILAIWLGPTIWTFYKHGLLTENNSSRKYEGNRSKRLKELYVGLMNYQESNGQLPAKSNWMDAIKNMIREHNMTPQQSDQKFHDPTLSSPSQYGFTFNQALSDKYSGDIKHQSNVIVIFTSKNLAKNSYGDPKTDAANPPRGGENLGINLKGKIVVLK